MKPVVIFGVGDFAQVACSYLRSDSDRPVAAFTVHAEFLTEPRVMNLDVVPFERLVESHPPADFAMLIAVGYKRLNRAREEIFNECKAAGYELITYVNSKACVSGDAEIGENCFIFEQNVIQPFASIGNNVVMWSGNHLGHHSQIEDHCFVASHAVISGRVVIGHHSFIGVNSTFKDGVKVAPRCVVGAGAIITRDTQEDEVFAPEPTGPSKVKSYQVRGLR